MNLISEAFTRRSHQLHRSSEYADEYSGSSSVIKYIYDNIMYAELNTKSDFCEVCGYDGEIKIIEDENGKLVWECPNCGNRDQDKLFVARRTCGYIGTQFWNREGPRRDPTGTASVRMEMCLKK